MKETYSIDNLGFYNAEKNVFFLERFTNQMSFSKSKRGKAPFESARSKRRSAEKEARKNKTSRNQKKGTNEADNFVASDSAQNLVLSPSSSSSSTSSASFSSLANVYFPPAAVPERLLEPEVHWTNSIGHALFVKTSFYVGMCLDSTRYCSKCQRTYHCRDDDDAERRSRGARHGGDLSICFACSCSDDQFRQGAAMDIVLDDIKHLHRNDENALATAHLRQSTVYGK